MADLFNDGDIEVAVEGLLRIDGGIMLFHGTADDGDAVTFGVDHRPGNALIDALFDGDTPVCLVPPWAILGRTRSGL